MAAHRHWRVLVDRVVNEVPQISCAGLLLRAAPGGPDLAAGKAVSAYMAHPSHPLANAFDGNPNTFWADGYGHDPRGGWIACDLGAGGEADIREISWRGRHDYTDSNFREARVQWSDDGLAWTDAWRVFEPRAWALGEARAYSAPARSAAGHRHWSVFGSKIGNATGVVLGEAQFRAVAGGPDLTDGPGAGTPGANSVWRGLAALDASKAFDGDAATIWAAASGGNGEGSGYYDRGNAWLAWDFGPGQARDVAEVFLQTRNDINGSAQQAPHEGWVGFSDDGLAWGVAGFYAVQPFTQFGDARTFAVPAAAAGGGAAATRRRFFLVR